MQYMELWLDRCVKNLHINWTIDLDGLADPTFKEIKIYYLDSMVHPPDFKIGELSWNKETPPLCTCTYINGHVYEDSAKSRKHVLWGCKSHFWESPLYTCIMCETGVYYMYYSIERTKA